MDFLVGLAGTGQPFVTYPQINFEPVNFFALGSPIALFLSTRGLENIGDDFKLPTSTGVFNIFHPFDPVVSVLSSFLSSVSVSVLQLHGPFGSLQEVWSPLQATVHLCGVYYLPWNRHSGTRDHRFRSHPTDPVELFFVRVLAVGSNPRTAPIQDCKSSVLSTRPLGQDSLPIAMAAIDFKT